MAFDDDFASLMAKPPFPWQRALNERFIAGDIPKACDLPTGLGKTSVIALWLLALAKNPKLPRRLVYVVNRRTVVDQATAEAERLRAGLLQPEVRHVREALDALAAVPAKHPLAISTLRGKYADNAEWRRDPSRPAIIVGTVDMIGSRLLFSGYGCSFRSRPLHAGFLGQDALLVHDEAHLEPAFQALLNAIVDEQQRSGEPRPLKVLALSATGRVEPDFTLGDEDLHNADVKKRLHARKGLQLHIVDDRKELPERIAAKAAELDGKIVVFLSSVEHAEKCAQALSRTKKGRVAVLTGTMRGAERDELVKNPVFARFLPRPDESVSVQEGTVFLVSTSAGEVGIDLSADHLVTDLPPFDAFAQRLGRVNRYGEGDAEVHVYCENLKEPPRPKGDSEEADEEDDLPGKRKDEYDYARFFTRALLSELPVRSDDRRDVSPWALRTLPLDARLRASTPLPEVHHVDALLFDRWSYTTITGALPGRPLVAEWLHGKAEWEPPRTAVAWRGEVAWLTNELLGLDTLDDFLADYPLRSREMLSDATIRILKHLEKLAARDKENMQRAWLVRPDGTAETMKLRELVAQYDSRKNPILDDATVVLAPEAGGLSKEGLFDSSVEFDSSIEYDLGPKQDERVVDESESDPQAPLGMRLVRSVKREVQGDDVLLWWHLYAIPQRADDDGSRTSRRELLLDVHLQRTEAWAIRLARSLALPQPQQHALARAARAHDLGKRRRVWQRSIKRFNEPPLAKGPMQPSKLGHYRHELGSLHDGDFSGLSDDEKDLALHVVAAHHGRARPHFPVIESYDPELRDDVVAALVREVPLRFDRLQRRFGRWGLAWLESILRAADMLGSEDEGVAE
ncbi:MAG TPA: type I-U CRISPR-associated helicase/endonuclease Cas3 [Steroidobacter sp.]|uniref:type I-G CRISPR-associated helicase/endonuclease Cas3g n=1 Tax=Steroidobacter sp. TaxID=1978227 RepID=UPI002ED8D3E9